MSWHEHELLQNIERIAVGMAITRQDGAIEYANRYLYRMLGLHGGEPAALPIIRPEILQRLIGQVEPQLDQTEGGGDTLRICSDGKVLDVLHAVYPLHDEALAITRFVHLLQYRSDAQQMQALHRLAFYDALTGLPNRNLLSDRLAHALAAARRNRTMFAVLYIDIDHFKVINDGFGHDSGDRLLHEVAGRLSQAVRATDTVARWGGDEFVAVLEGAGEQAAAGIASKLLAACGEPYLVRGRQYRITLSVGASFYPRDGGDAAALLERADAAMYQVKVFGRNGYRIEESPSSYRRTAA
jgi:diguanylate cyclase (GGDEF)-like protein